MELHWNIFRGGKFWPWKHFSHKFAMATNITVSLEILVGKLLACAVISDLC